MEPDIHYDIALRPGGGWYVFRMGTDEVVSDEGLTEEEATFFCDEMEASGE